MKQYKDQQPGSSTTSNVQTTRQVPPTSCLSYSLTNSQIGVDTRASNYLVSIIPMRKTPSETTSKEHAWVLEENIRYSIRYHTLTRNTIRDHSLSRLQRSGMSHQPTVIILHHLMSPNLLLYRWFSGYMTRNGLWQTRKQVSGATIILIGVIN